MENTSLSALVGRHLLAVLGTYQHSGDGMDVYICGVDVVSDERLKVRFPLGHQLSVGQKVTLHLDNRTGISDYDAELHVYRLSYKGQIRELSEHEAIIDALEYQVFYGIAVEKAFRQIGYQFPSDERQSQPLPVSLLEEVAQVDQEEHENKIGVLLTYAEAQPHTTVMAFLSTVNDDIFFITLPGTFKSQLLKKDNRCYFAIDSRATFTFEQAVQWNYSIIQGRVAQVVPSNPIFAHIRELFIHKNPWEVGFFSHPEIELYHLKPEHVICPGQKPL